MQVSQAAKCDEEAQLRRDLSVYRTEATRYCLTADCVRTTEQVLGRMDLGVDPCDDFWLYSCGGWLRDNRARPAAAGDGESWGVEDEMELSVARYVRRQLEAALGDCHDPDERRMTAVCKMRLLYTRCTDTDAVDAVGAQPLQEILDDLGGWSALGLRATRIYIRWTTSNPCDYQV